MKTFNIDFYGHRRIYYIISSALIAIMLIFALIFGIGLDIQFKGGALITYSFEGDLDADAFTASAEDVLGQSITLQVSSDAATGLSSYVISLPTTGGIDSEVQLALTERLQSDFAQNNVQMTSINVVEPSIGSEFLAKCLVALLFTAVLMVIYIAIRFKKISGFTAGFTAVLALIHDVLMVLAVFVVFRIPLDANFMAVALTILGYSLNDTIVIYDRVRENKRINPNMTTPQLMNLSLNQSFKRSLMTTVTTVTAMVVVAVVAYIYNVDSIMSFAFPMIAGMVSGFYSSVCIAPNLWVALQQRKAQAA